MRLDRPERGERLAALVDRLGPEDAVTVVGDLCDFWFASRQRNDDPERCAGLKALIAFTRRGGRLTILPGNHDAWLGSFFEQTLGARFAPEPLRVTSFGTRLYLAHGHLLGARAPWKGIMESRAFLWAFSALPNPIARLLAARLDVSNLESLEQTHRRHLKVYRHFVERLDEDVDLVLLGHVHDVFNESVGAKRMIVLGDWLQGASYLRIDGQGERFEVQRPSASAQAPSTA